MGTVPVPTYVGTVRAEVPYLSAVRHQTHANEKGFMVPEGTVTQNPLVILLWTCW